MKKVNRVEQQIIKRNNPIYKIVDQYCFYSKNVYNQANYIIRQEFINNKNKIQLKSIVEHIKNTKIVEDVLLETVLIVDVAILIYGTLERSNKRI